MKKRYSVAVYSDGKLIKSVDRVLYFEQIGNFNPCFTIFSGYPRLVHSFRGDMSDPFRRDNSYLDHLYINLTPMIPAKEDQ